MATSTSQANAKVTLDSSSFVRGAKAVMSAAEEMAVVIEAAFAAAAVAVSAFAAGIGVLGYQVKQVVEFGEQMANAGHAANIAAGRFYLFHNAVEKGLSLKTVANLIGENAEVLNRSANVFRDVALKLWVVGEKIRGFWLGMVDRLAPVLSRLLDGALAISLVRAGQAFGDAIAKSIEVVYQLAKDGKLWSTIKDAFEIAFQYAAERLVWLAGLAYKLLKYSFADAIIDSIGIIQSSLWDALKDLAKQFADLLVLSFVNSFQVINSLILSALKQVDSALVAAHLLTDKQASSREKAFAGLTLKIPGFENVGQSKTPTNALDDLAKIFSSTQFKGSDSLKENMEGFSKTIGEALAGYKRDEVTNPPTTFENNTRRQAFGADSLAAIGAGGNVYVGLSVLDVNKRQLDQLMQINAKLSGGRVATDYDHSPQTTESNSISRIQTNGVIAKN